MLHVFLALFTHRSDKHILCTVNAALVCSDCCNVMIAAAIQLTVVNPAPTHINMILKYPR